MSIPQSFVQELLARVDLVDVVGRYVPLKRSGANFTGLCPFHSEKSPSFTVSPSKQFYHCFGCGQSGDAIGFLMAHGQMGFVEAVHELAQQFGLVVPDETTDPQDRARQEADRNKRLSLTQALEQANHAYQKLLKNSPKAIDYCKQRGLSGQIAKRFGLGYAPAGWHGLAAVFADYADPTLVEAGLVIQQESDDAATKRYDRFRDRLMFPIRNTKGLCIGFGGRVLGDEKPKYLNSPETPVFSKGRELYGLFEARAAIREAGYALVTEGYMDVVALAQLGFPNAVATLGTACTAEHLQQLLRFTDSVVFAFDGDAAGRRAARKALTVSLPLAKDTRSIKFLFLPPEHDPDSYVRAHGTAAFARCITEAVTLSRFLLDCACEGCDLHQPEGRALLASQAKPLWEALPEGALKQQLLQELAQAVRLPPRELTQIWFPQRRKRAEKAPEKEYFDSKELAIDAGYKPKTPKNSAVGGSLAPWSRADHAARLLLDNLELLGSLTTDDLNLLRNLPPPHGPLFTWLEGQWHEHGAQPWVALQQGLRGHVAEALARQLMTGFAGSPPAEDDASSLVELRSLVNLMLIDQIKREETAAIEAAKTQPEALARYRDLQARRRLLESAARPA